MDWCCKCTCIPPVCKHALMCVGSCTPCGCVRAGLLHRNYVNYAASNDSRIPKKHQDPNRACPCLIGCLCCPLVIAHHNRWWRTMREIMGAKYANGEVKGAPGTEWNESDDELDPDKWAERDAWCTCGYPWLCCDDTACCEDARCCPCSVIGYPCGFSEVIGIEHLALPEVLSPRGNDGL